MLQACLIASTLGWLGPASADDRRAAGALLAAFEANRASLASFGTIRFHARDGAVADRPGVEEFSAALKGDWPRWTRSDGTFLFDGEHRRYENGYSAAEMFRYTAANSDWTECIPSCRLLTDGGTTLVDTIALDREKGAPAHFPGLRAGLGPFFHDAYAIPIHLGDPDPPFLDLSRHLGDALQGRGGAVLAEFDPGARLDGISVVRVRVAYPGEPARHQVTAWVDPARGALPVQIRVEISPDRKLGVGILQINHDDIRRLDRGWLPFRRLEAEPMLTPTGGTLIALAHEVVIESADFADRPPASAFALTFPEPVALSSPPPTVDLGNRRVWDIGDFSPEAVSRAALRKGPRDPDGASALLPSWTGWASGPITLAMLGLALLSAFAIKALRSSQRS